MASAAASQPDRQPSPALLSAYTPLAIRDALAGTERAEFEQRYAHEMSTAASTLDLTGVLTVLETFRKIAEITQRQGPDAHQRMLSQVDRIQHGDKVTTVSGHDHKAEINARLNR